MNKIQKLSRFLKWVFAFIFCAWPIALFFIWFQNQSDFLAAGIGLSINNFIPANLASQIITPLSLTAKVWGFMVSWIPATVSMFISWYLMRLFGCYEREEIFTHRSIRYIRHVGIWMIVWAIVNPIYQVLMSLTVTLGNPVGQRVITLELGTDYFRNLLTAGVVFIVAHIMQQGLKLKQDHDLTV